jgi:hypothetical protein
MCIYLFIASGGAFNEFAGCARFALFWLLQTRLIVMLFY